MAFDATLFARASAHQNRLIPYIWVYGTTSDSDATVQTADYFLEKYPDLKVGDLIYTYTSDGAALLKFATVAAGGVTVGVIDTD